MGENPENREPEANPRPDQGEKPKSKVISAKELGLSLILSREDLEELDRIEKERLSATLKAQEQIVLWD